MSVKTQALVRTALFIGTMILGGVAMSTFLEYVDPSPQAVMYGVSFVLVLVMFYIVYSINVSQIEYKKKLEEMTRASVANQ
jgi:quinol-cytochrome oxidoreductase complex cytochrome b subunit